MSQLIAHEANGNAHGHAHGHHAQEAHVAARAHLDLDAVTPAPGFGTTLSRVLWFVGLVGVLATIVGAFTTQTSADPHAAVKHALGAYHTGVLYVIGLALGALGTSMILQQVNAGWSAAVRRQAEVISSLVWVGLVLFLPVIILEVFVFHGRLFSWMDPEHTAGDVLFEKKAGFLNPTFWVIRACVYFFIWIALSTRLFRLSREQDQTGDKWLTAKARFTSSYGLLLFALTAAFASFDWLMSLDYHWFSTMFGVYFFAGSIVSSTALLCVILTTLRIKGKMGAAFTQEHQHDLGKLLFAFTVFWAYITLCQYFLIWYSNIPEETAFYNLRKEGGWKAMTIFICAGHFALPFLLLLIRDLKRNPHTLRLIALWMLVMHAFDLFFLVRPVIKSVALGSNVWIDVFGIVGPVLLFLGFVVHKLGTVPFIPIKDPRLHEVLAHKNYV